MQIKTLGIFAHVGVYVGYIHGIAYGHQMHSRVARRGSKYPCYARLQSQGNINYNNNKLNWMQAYL